MATVTFEAIGRVDDALLKYAVIVSRTQGQWIFCQHEDRDTWEIPGGRREPGEDILATARRELWEETGAIAYDLSPVCAYSVCRDGGAVSHGLLCFAEVHTLDALPPLEIARIQLLDDPPEALTYPELQPVIFRYIQNWLGER